MDISKMNDVIYDEVLNSLVDRLSYTLPSYYDVLESYYYYYSIE